MVAGGFPPSIADSAVVREQLEDSFTVHTAYTANIPNFLNNPTNSGYYTSLVTNTKNWISTLDKTREVNGGNVLLINLRVVVVLPDGKVVYDSYFDNTNNTINNFANIGQINENHNTRSHVIELLTTSNSITYSNKFSTTVQEKTNYMAFKMGTQYAPKGTVIISFKSSE
jgi:coenzyme F420-reducing hydrogenase alpha subunit